MQIKRILGFLNEKIIFYIFLIFIIQIFFILGIGICSFIAPDERIYSRILDLIFTNQIHHLTLPTEGKSFIYLIYLFPAKILTSFGIDNIFALRINSMFYYCLSILFIKRILEQSAEMIKNLNLKIFLVSIMPSVFIFTALGLRESYLIFLLTLFFLGLSTIQTKKVALGIFEIVLSLFILLNFKYYLGLIVLITLIVTIFISQNRMFVSWKKLFILIIPMVVFATLQFGQQWDGYSQATPDTSSTQTSSTLINLQFCVEKNQLGFLRGPILNTLEPTKFMYTDGFSDERALKGSASDYFHIAGFRSIKGLVPNTLIYLAAPILPITSSAPLKQLFYLDGVLFSFFFITVISLLFYFLRSRYLPKPLWVACISFTVIFILFSGLAESNLGTVLRHRILLVVPALLMTLSLPAYFHDKPQGGNHIQ